PGNAMFEWLYPLHTGKLVGTPYRVLLVLAGCVPLLSLVTGLIVWRSRAARKRAAARPDAMPAPSRTSRGTP
ncbi:MAG TPA: PepSY domain-containing protein, partial [Usitatibacter sp.]|nr:PepSY domain-containing protein [Usitatibacter sp.]